MNNSSHKPLAERLEEWKQKYGNLCTTPRGAPYYRIDIPDRYASLIALIIELREEGRERRYFDAAHVKDDIITSCMPPEAYPMTSKSRRGWKNAVHSDLINAIATAFSQEYLSSDKIIVVESRDQKAPVVPEFNPAKQGRLSSDIDESIKSRITEGPVIRIADPELEKLLGFDDNG